MNASYQVGAEFILRDLFTPVLRGMFEELNKFDALVDATNKKLADFGAGTGTALIASLGAVTTEFDKVVQGANASGTSIVDRFRLVGTEIDKSIATGVDAAITKIGSMTKALEDANRAARISFGGGGIGGGGGHRGPTGGDGHGHGVGMDTAITGFIGAEEGGHFVFDILKHGAELQHVQEQMLQGGMKSAEVADATAASWREAAKYGLDVSKVMGDIKELRFPFGSTEHAIKFIDPLEQMRVVLNSVSEGTGNQSADAVYKMARAGELKGLVDPEEYLSYFENMTKVISATGGKVGPNDFMQATKYSKVAAFGYDEDFYTKYLPTAIQTMGASTAGTSLMSLFNTLVGGAVTKRSFGEMEDLGLIGDESKVEWVGTQFHGMRPGAIKGTDELARNPLKWAEDVLLPLLEAKYGDISNPENKEQAIQALGGLFGNRNTAAAVAELAFRSKSFERDKGLIGEAKGLGGSSELLAHDPTAAVSNFEHAWANLLTALGSSSVQPAIDMLNGVTAGFTALGSFIKDNPALAKDLVGLTGGLVVGLAAIAAVGLSVFIPGGIVAVALTTLTGALVGLLAVNWSTVTESFDHFLSVLKSIPDAVINLFNGFMSRLRSIPGMSALLGDDVSGIKGHPSHPFTPTPQHGGATGDWGPDGQPPAGYVPMAFVTGGGSGDGSLEDSIYRGTLRAFTDFANGVSPGADGGGGGGSGFMNASWGGGGGFGSGRLGAFNPSAVGGGSWSQAGVTQGTVADYIRHAAAANGIDPETAVKVARSEGLGSYTGDYGTSFGAFQLHYGGSGIAGMNSGGLGDAFTRATGLDARDPKTWKAQVDFAMKMARQGGWSPWHGAAHVGIGPMDGIGTYHGPALPESSADLSAGGYSDAFRKNFHGEWGADSKGNPVAIGKGGVAIPYDVAPKRPSFVPPAKTDRTVPVNTVLNIDGKIVAENVVHHVLRDTERTHSHSYHDDHSSWAGGDVAFG